MIRVVKTLTIHILCIIFFAFFYYYFSVHFDDNKQHKYYNRKSSNLESLIDFVLFSTTIQAGVGISDIIPISIYGKMLMIMQQLLMLSIHVITIYVFTSL
jgi:hypothetical protein